MDTSFWNSLNSVIKLKHTKKQYFNKYLWRLEITCEFADLIDPKYTDMVAEVNHRRAKWKNINFGGSWRHVMAMTRNPNKVDFVLLLAIRKIKTLYKNDIKIRVEDPWIQFYTEDEQTLKALANSLSNFDCIRTVTGPEPGTENLLTSNKIIAGNKTTHKYKIMIRDGSYTPALKQQILSLLDAQGDEVKISQGLRHSLTRPYPGTWGLYFYTNDLGVTTMLNLMSPGIVGKIYEIVHTE